MGIDSDINDNKIEHDSTAQTFRVGHAHVVF